MPSITRPLLPRTARTHLRTSLKGVRLIARGPRASGSTAAGRFATGFFMTEFGFFMIELGLFMTELGFFMTELGFFMSELGFLILELGFFRTAANCWRAEAMGGSACGTGKPESAHVGHPLLPRCRREELFPRMCGEKCLRSKLPQLRRVHRRIVSYEFAHSLHVQLQSERRAV